MANLSVLYMRCDCYVTGCFFVVDSTYYVDGNNYGPGIRNPL